MRLGDCKHFNGCLRNATCDAGVNYRELVGGDDLGWAMRIPCTNKPTQTVECSKVDRASQADVDAWKRQRDAALAGVLPNIQALTKVKAEHRGKKVDVRGQIECATCKGVLRWSIAGSNGHMAARCDTPKCFFIME